MEELEQEDSYEVPQDFEGYQAFLQDLDDPEALTSISNFDTDLYGDDNYDFDEEDSYDEPYRFHLDVDDAEMNMDAKQVHSLFSPVLKSSSVNYEGVSNEIKSYLSSLPEDLRSKVVITSGMDSKHAKNSKHYTGNAVDIRYNPDLHNYIAKTASASGLRTINPFHGTAPHTHLEKMQFGGVNILDMSDPLAKSMLESIQKGIQSSKQPSGFNLSTVANGLDTLNSGIDTAKGISAAVGQQIYNFANSGLDSAISILGQNAQNRELQRLQDLRNSDLLKSQSPTVPIKNIPAYI